MNITIFQKINNLIRNIPDTQKVFTLTMGFIFTWIYKTPITAALFNGKGFYGRNILYQLLFVVFFTLFFAGILLLLLKLLQLLPFFGRFLKTCESRYQSMLQTMKEDRVYRMLVALGILSAGVVVIFLINNLLVNIDTEQWLYTAHTGLPFLSPIGWDFRNGVYRPAQNLFIDHSLQQIWTNKVNTNTYPPFVLLLGLCYLPFNENTAYVIHLAFLFLASIASLVIATLIIKEYLLKNLGISKNMVRLVSGFVFFVTLILLFISYPFAFLLERGNYDVFAIFFSLLAVWVLLRHPEKLWTQVILLTVATHLKIYPAILFFLLLKQHGKKMILPVLGANLFFLFILGPNNTFAFFNTLTQSYGANNHWLSYDNHSSYSFVWQILENYLPVLKPRFVSLWILFTLIPVVLWGIVTVKLFKKNATVFTLVTFFIVSVTVMDLIPTVSHDYKLTILFPSIALLMAMILRSVIVKGETVDFLQLAALLIVILLLTRSYSYFGELNFFYLAKKYLWSLSLALLALWSLFRMELKGFKKAEEALSASDSVK